MQYRVALDPKLDLSAAEFAEAWNNSEHAADGTAAVDESPQESFLPMEITVALITAGVSIPATVLVNFVSEYLKKKFIEKDAPKVTVTTISTPDGQPVLIIKEEEK